jgi:hypothetical protein
MSQHGQRDRVVSEETVEKMRGCMQDRGLYLALLMRSFSKVFPKDQVEKAAREAIYEYGQFKGSKDKLQPITAEDWVDGHVSRGMGDVFESTIIKEGGCCKQQMTKCALLDAWKDLGCTPEEIDLYCDVAMELDRSRADYHGLEWEIPLRMGKGDSDCCVVLKNKRKR